MAETKINTELPFNGQFFEPLELKSQVVFILVHHYGGNKRTLTRHIKLVNSLGYRAFAFDLEGAHNQKMFLPPLSKRWQWGLRFMWADRIEQILNLIEGDKIILTLSNPSFSVLEAVYRIQALNIKAIISDGGPFFNVTKCYWNLFTYAFQTLVPIRALQLLFGCLYWNPFNYKKQGKRYIKSFNHKVPYLAFRAENDKLVPVESIDKCIDLYEPNMLTKVLLKDCGHLQGLKVQKQLYTQSIVNFLKSI